MSTNSTIDPNTSPARAGGFKFFHYDPSGAAAITFAVIFGLSTLLHLYQMIRTRTWYLLAFIIGGIFSTVGYIGRYLCSQQTPNWTLGPFIQQTLLLLLAPALFAATIYMELKHIIALVQAEHLSPVRLRWLTKLFVGGDVISFLLQCGGGGLLATKKPKTMDVGQNIIVVGLFAQLAFFGLFGVTALVFHIRVNRKPTPLSNHPGMAWRKHIYALYFMSILIMIRSIFRVVEYLQGRTGYLLLHEIYLYIFDALLMTIVAYTMNFIHPSEIDALAHGGLVSRLGGFRMESIGPVDGKAVGDGAKLQHMRPHYA